MTSATQWDPSRYNTFAAEREQPFWDLAALVEPVDSPALVDLGCGDGRLTAELHARLGAKSTVGVDSSPAMLEAASARTQTRLRFVAGDIAKWPDGGDPVDVVFSNAALQWVGDHEEVVARWRGGLADHGQLAVQVPSNDDHPAHGVLRAFAAGELGSDAPADPVAANVLAPQRYAELLYELGFARQSVQLRVYTHLLDSSAAVLEWMKGTSLTRFKAVMSPEEYERFVAEYGERLVTALGDKRPYFYPFKRILIWGRLA